MEERGDGFIGPIPLPRSSPRRPISGPKASPRRVYGPPDVRRVHQASPIPPLGYQVPEGYYSQVVDEALGVRQPGHPQLLPAPGAAPYGPFLEPDPEGGEDEPLGVQYGPFLEGEDEHQVLNYGPFLDTDPSEDQAPVDPLPAPEESDLDPGLNKVGEGSDPSLKTPQAVKLRARKKDKDSPPSGEKDTKHIRGGDENDVDQKEDDVDDDVEDDEDGDEGEDVEDDEDDDEGEDVEDEEGHEVNPD